MKTHARATLAAGIAATALAAAVPAAYGFEFQLGELDASFDTDIGWGLSMRTADPDSKNLGAYGNRALFEDKWDIFNNSIKGSHTFEVRGDTYGALLRGNWFYDFEMANQDL
ncbi:MAG TPA: peptide ABC transporter substrate-binding protein, partial [Gammaproteobacteria bacterium]|nr:peptide ABC transporter substrate-binding protein [Gammaproteobacteria bacterium]MCH78201.1 peptide ABC transporter substrate-binding protein [Gammaproteobacteria bacterium]